MRKSVVENYPQLWHYTTALGLHGILTSQQLWATDIRYLNDAEELTGFFDRKLLHLLQEGIRKGISEALKTTEGLIFVSAAGGPEVLEKDFSNQLLDSLRKVTMRLEVYVTSFCSTPLASDSEDGLLSQWRGYGPDGGYAIVFDTQGLDELLVDEQRRYSHSFAHWGDVDYFDGDTSATRVGHAEALDWEADIRKTVASIVLNQNLHPTAEALFEPIIGLSTRHKHRGFREESEVRISALTSNDEIIREVRTAGENREKKPVYFTPRGGLLVPHIALFERPTGEAAKLPIRKIIVGPHPEKLKRQKAVEMLLGQLGIDAEVVPSDIPYLGRS